MPRKKSSKYWKVPFTKKGKIKKLNKTQYLRLRRQFKNEMGIDIGTWKSYRKKLKQEK